MAFLGGLFNSSSSSSVNYGQMYHALLKYYPQLQSEQNAMASGNAVSSAEAQLAAQQATAGQQNQLMTQLYSQYAPQLAAAGAAIGGQTQLAQAGNNASVANSAQGQAALKASIAADQAANPEYYATRSADSNALNSLLGADVAALNNPLSPTVTRAVDQSLARQNSQTGTSNVPSQAQTVSNAMQYGQAGYNQQEQAKQDLSSAIGNATSFLPQSQSQVGGMNAWNTVTGGANETSNTANDALGLFGGINGVNSNTGNTLGTMLGNVKSGQTDTNSPSIWSSISGLASALGGPASALTGAGSSAGGGLASAIGSLFA